MSQQVLTQKEKFAPNREVCLWIYVGLCLDDVSRLFGGTMSYHVAKFMLVLGTSIAGVQHMGAVLQPHPGNETNEIRLGSVAAAECCQLPEIFG